MNESSWNNKSSVLKKVKQDGNNLRFASPNLKADRSIVFEAFRETEESIYFADPSLLEDSSFVCKLLKTNIHCYSFLPKNIQTHQECVLTAIKNGNPFFILFNPSILNDSEQNLAFLNATADFFEQHRLTDLTEGHWTYYIGLKNLNFQFVNLENDPLTVGQVLIPSSGIYLLD